MNRIPKLTFLLIISVMVLASACVGNAIQPEDTQEIGTITPVEMVEEDTPEPVSTQLPPEKDKKSDPPGLITIVPPVGIGISNDFIDWESTSIEILESFPVQVRLYIAGALPNPCHTIHYELNEPDSENRIFVRFYTTIEKGINCIQVITPFSEVIELGSYAGGTYTVYVNGFEVGEFTI